MILQTLPFANGKFYGRSNNVTSFITNHVDNSLLPLLEFTHLATRIHNYTSDYILQITIRQENFIKKNVINELEYRKYVWLEVARKFPLLV